MGESWSQEGDTATGKAFGEGREQKGEIPVLSFPHALQSSSSDSRWPNFPGSQLVREQNNAILCNKEQSKAKGQRMDLRRNKQVVEVQETWMAMQPTICASTQG